MHHLLVDFLNYVYLERRLSKHTFSAYRRDLERYLSFLKRENKSLPEVKAEDITAFLWEEKEKGKKSPASLARSLSAVKSFHHFLVSYGVLKEDVTLLLASLRLPERMPQVLEMEEVEALLQEPDKHEGWEAKRDKGILELLYATGMRVSELANLTLSRVDIKEKIVRCIGKGNKERIIPFGEKARSALIEYVQRIRPVLDKKRSEYLFLTAHGNRLSRQRIWQIVKRYIRWAGIKKEVSPHTLRHSFATHLLQHKASLRVVQAMLGHSNIVTTEIYTHLNPSRLKGVHQKYHPLGEE
ncbi:MAG: site-specific tyrosine recombinase XerD [Candidatus Omnitrophota bacterium]|nr:MAG: site-specific tyrosine recombinase XerD [Candidatus Omnitrophota bacterium]